MPSTWSFWVVARNSFGSSAESNRAGIEWNPTAVAGRLLRIDTAYAAHLGNVIGTPVAEVQDVTFGGGLDGPIPGVTEVQTVTVSGSLPGRDAATAQIEQLTIGGSLAGPIAGTQELQVATLSGSVPGELSDGVAEVQALSYSGTRSAVALPGQDELVTIALPDDFDSGDTVEVFTVATTFSSVTSTASTFQIEGGIGLDGLEAGQMISFNADGSSPVTIGIYSRISTTLSVIELVDGDTVGDSTDGDDVASGATIYLVLPCLLYTSPSPRDS